MSTTIDDRVVQMRFDNKDFEKNVATTMSTLDKFKEKLKFRGTEKEFDAITNAANKVSLKHLEDSADNVGNKFSMMSVVAITAVSRMTDRIISQAERLVKSLSIDQITSGWDKYNTKVSKVQTIMNSTGKSIDVVNEQLDRLMWYTDETSYNFIDMVDSIGKFTNNSVDLNLAVTAMQGISNWAGLVGANTQEASRAMYNLSQAIGTGTVEFIDWKSIENANMADATFKQMVIDAAVARGTLLKVGDAFTTLDKKVSVSASNFNKGLSKGWFTSDVLLDVLNEYGKFSNALYDAVEETSLGARELMNAIDEYKTDEFDMSHYMEETGLSAERLTEILSGLGDETMEFSMKAFKSSQESKTFADAINAVKDAVSTGWMKSFEIIIGDLNKAKEIWSAFGDEMWEIFAGGADARNRMLQKWSDMGGRDLMLETIRKAWEKLKKVVETVKKAFRNVFPKKTAQDLYNITYEIHHFIDSIKLSEEALEGISKVVEKIASILKVFTVAAKIAVAIGMGLILRLVRVASNIISVVTNSEKMKEALIGALGEERYQRLANALNQIFNNLVNLFIYLKDKFNETFEGEGFSSKFINALMKVWDILEPLALWILDRIIDGLEIIGKIDFRPLFDMIGTGISNIKGALVSIGDFFKPIGTVIEKLFADLKGDSPSEALDNLQNNIRNLNLDFKMFKNNFTMDGILGKIKTAAYGATGGIENVATKIMDLIQKLNPGKILAFGFGTALTGLLYTAIDLTKALTNMANSFKGVGTALQERIRPNKVAQISKALVLLAGALVVMSMVDAEKLKGATNAMMHLMIGLGVVMAGLAAVNKFLVNEDKVKGIQKGLDRVVGLFLKLAVSLAVLAAGVVILSRMDMEGIIDKVIVLIFIMGALVLAAKFLSKYEGKLDGGGKTLLAYAAGVWIIIKALQGLADADMNGIKKNIGALVIALTSLIMLSAIANRTGGFSGSMGIIASIAGIWLMVKLLKKLANEDIPTLIQGLIAFIPLFVTLRLLFIGMKRAGESAQKTGMGILAISASMWIIAQVLKEVGEISWQDALQGGLAVAGLMAAMIVLVRAFAGKDVTGFENADKVGKALLKLSIGIAILSLAIKMIGGMRFEEAVQGLVAVSVILVIFKEIISTAKEVTGATAPIIALTMAIGMITAAMVILSLIPTKDALGAAAALSMTLWAFGKAIQSLQNIKFWSALGQAVVFAAVVSTITGALLLLTNFGGSWDQLVAAGGALSATLIAFGAAFRLLGRIRMRDVKSKLAILAGILVEVGVAFYLLRNLDVKNMIGHATALGIVLTAVGLSLALMSGMTGKIDFKQLLTMFGGIAAVILVAAGAFKILEGVDGANMIKQAIALDALLIVTSAVLALATIVGKFSNGQWTPMLIGLAGLGIIIAGIAAICGVIGGLGEEIGAKIGNGVEIMASFKSLAGTLLVFTLVTAAVTLLGTMATATGSIAIFVGVSALLLVISCITMLIYALGDLINDPNTKDIIKNGSEVFKQIGDAIGGFFGNIIGGFAEGISSHLPAIGTDLGKFMENAQPFFDGVDSLGSENVTKVGYLMECIKAVMDQDLWDVVINKIFGNDTLSRFAEELTKEGGFADSFLEFVSSIKEVGVENVDSATNALNAMCEFAKTMANAQGFFDKLLGGDKLYENLGSGLASLADGFTEYSNALNSCEYGEEQKKKTQLIADSIDILNKAMPAAPGTLKYWFNGTMDVGLFGMSLPIFGAGVAAYALMIAEISEDQWKNIEQSAKVGETLAEFAKSLPAASDSKFNYWFNGTMDVGVFGTQLPLFGWGIKQYAQMISNMTDADWERIKASAAAGETMSELADSLPHLDANGNFSGWFFSTNNNFQRFGEQIKAFGEALAAYNDSLGSTNFSTINASTSALHAFITLADGIPSDGFLGLDGLDDFGKDIKKFGEHLSEYYGYLNGIDLEKVDTATSSISKIINILSQVKYIESNTADILSTTLERLAELGIESFANTFENATEEFKDVGTNFVNKVATGMRKNLQVIRDVVKEIVKALVDEIDSKQEDIKSTAESFATKVVEAFTKVESNMVKAGENLIGGLIKGITGKQKDLNNALTKAALGSVRATEKAYEIKSPSRKFVEIGKLDMQGLINGVDSKAVAVNNAMTNVADRVLNLVNRIFGNTAHESQVFNEIGGFMMTGIQNGISDKCKNAEEAMVKASEGMLNTTQKWWMIHSPSVRAKDEIGHYIIDGIADGITEDMSAEEAAKQKAANIVEAFQTEFDRVAENIEHKNLAFELYKAMYGDVLTDDELQNAQIQNIQDNLAEQKDAVIAAKAEWDFMIEQFGEDSREAIQAEDIYMKNLKEMAELAQQLIELQSGGMESTRSWLEDAEAMNNQMKDYYDSLIAMGKSEEEAAVLRDRRNLDYLLFNSTMDKDQIGEYREAIQGMYDTFINQGYSELEANKFVNKLAHQKLSQFAVDRTLPEQAGMTIAEVVESYLGEFTTGVDIGLYKTVKDTVASGVYDGLGEGFDNYEDEIQKEIEKITGSGEYTDYGAIIMDAVFGRISYEEAVKQLKKMGHIDSIISFAKDKFNLDISSWFDLGVAKQEGDIEGYKSKQQEAEDTVESGQEALLEIGKKVNGINSPSTEYFDIAVFCLEGLINGFQDQATRDKLTETVVGVCEELMEIMRSYNPTSQSVAKSILENFTEGIRQGVIFSESQIVKAIEVAITDTLTPIFVKIGVRVGQAISTGIETTIVPTVNGTLGSIGSLTQGVYTAINAAEQAAMSAASAVANSISSMVASLSDGIAAMSSLASSAQDIFNNTSFGFQNLDLGNGVTLGNLLTNLGVTGELAQQASATGMNTTIITYNNTTSQTYIVEDNGNSVRTPSRSEDYRKEKSAIGIAEKVRR